MSKIQRILVATDFSSGAVAAARYACELARSVGASITLLHVIPAPNWLLPDGSVIIADARTLAHLESATVDALASARSRLLDEDVPVETTSVIGAAAPEIVRFAQEGGYDLIVMGTHGRTGLKHVLLGSIAERVVRTSTLPVLTVHDQPEEGRPIAGVC